MGQWILYCSLFCRLFFTFIDHTSSFLFRSCYSHHIFKLEKLNICMAFVYFIYLFIHSFIYFSLIYFAWTNIIRIGAGGITIIYYWSLGMLIISARIRLEYQIRISWNLDSFLRKLCTYVGFFADSFCLISPSTRMGCVLSQDSQILTLVSMISGKRGDIMRRRVFSWLHLLAPCTGCQISATLLRLLTCISCCRPLECTAAKVLVANLQ